MMLEFEKKKQNSRKTIFFCNGSIYKETGKVIVFDGYDPENRAKENILLPVNVSDSRCVFSETGLQG